MRTAQFERSEIWQHHPDGLALLERQSVYRSGDEHLVIVKVNPAMERLFDNRSLVGRPAQVLVPVERLSSRDPGEVYATLRADGSTFPITSSLVDVGPPHDLAMLVIRDVTRLSTWRDEIPDLTTQRIVDLEGREQALVDERELLTQYLFAAGIALQLCAQASGNGPDHQHVERAISVLDELMNNLMSTT